MLDAFVILESYFRSHLETYLEVATAHLNPAISQTTEYLLDLYLHNILANF